MNSKDLTSRLNIMKYWRPRIKRFSVLLEKRNRSLMKTQELKCPHTSLTVLEAGRQWSNAFVLVREKVSNSEFYSHMSSQV